MTDIDDRIRDSVSQLVRQAPQPVPFDDLNATPARQRPGTSSRRWVAIAAGVITIAGVGGIAAYQARDDDPVPATSPTVPAPDPTTAPSATTPEAGGPATTAPDATPTTRPPLPDPRGLTTGPFPEIPPGSIEAATGDLIGVDTDGNIALYRDVVAAGADPVVLVDTALQPGQHFLGLEAIAVNGSLLTPLPVGWSSEGTDNGVTVLTQPEQPPMALVTGSLDAVSRDGTRFLVRERTGVRSDLAVYDAASGTVTRRGVGDFRWIQQYLWSADGREIYGFTADNTERQAELIRLDSTTLEILERVILEDWPTNALAPYDHTYMFGMWGDALVFATQAEVGVRAYTMPDLTPLEIETPRWVPTGSNGVTYFDLTADGLTAVFIEDGITYIQRFGDKPIAVRDDLVEVAFVEEVSSEPANDPDSGESPSLDVPTGSIDAAPGDMVSLSVDGDLWWHPGAFDPTTYGRSPGAPIRLVDGPDPRAEFDEMPPNHVSWFGGFINGALIYGDCCEPAAGNVFVVAEPEGAAERLRYGWIAAADAGGERWAFANGMEIAVSDYANEREWGRPINDEGGFLSVESLSWSPDGSELWVLGSSMGEGEVFLRFDTELNEIGRRVLSPPDADGGRAGRFEFAGRLADGKVLVAEHRLDGTVVALHVFDAAGELVAADTPWDLPAGTTAVQLSPDGTTLAVVAGTDAYLVREGEAPVLWSPEVTAVWFVH